MCTHPVHSLTYMHNWLVYMRTDLCSIWIITVFTNQHTTNASQHVVKFIASRPPPPFSSVGSPSFMSAVPSLHYPIVRLQTPPLILLTKCMWPASLLYMHIRMWHHYSCGAAGLLFSSLLFSRSEVLKFRISRIQYIIKSCY